MVLYNNDLYMEDLRYICDLNLPWEKLKNKTILISGATGLLGSFFVDVILEKNFKDDLGCEIYALGRNEGRAKYRFRDRYYDQRFTFISHDIKKPLVLRGVKTIDYVLHLASNTHPMQYASDPIGTIDTNIIGLRHMLDFAVCHETKRFVFASSNEIYGENRGDIEFFDESYCGYIDCNTMRAGYPESKRCGEALCQAYRKQKNLDVVIPRFTRSYGPTMLLTDTKAISQFILKGIAGENIVLKSAGTQYYSYTYVADAVSGLITILLKSENGEAYNIADELSDIMLRDLASLIADLCGKRVVYELPDIVEAVGYSTATKARLDGNKLRSLGWRAKYDIRSGIARTLDILRYERLNVSVEDS